MSTAARPHRHVRVEHIMGTAMAIHVVARPDLSQAVDAAARRCFADLRRVDRLFSTYRPESAISRVQRGEAAIDDLDPLIGEVARSCSDWERATHGRFSANWRGVFDPTGYVKGWSAERAARTHLEPLLAVPGVVAAGISAGGDLQLLTAPGEAWRWRVGIADPARPGSVTATIEIANGAVATSGTRERGAHILDPLTGRPAEGVASATVVADSLAVADVRATAAVVAGFDDLGWIAAADTRTGLIVAADGRVRRWLGSTEIAVEAASPLALVASV
ncbi:FAD:protein FMN transferase [Microbacterium sulfonylureivorans]|uniref:FAD:protein FMN transferase n=1 Tax=Microbacterium sulfonylureivorans TaxID=2486854 RepID=UPI000FD86CCA|nr:FAD:protein FMN transferase [Microbacterium sulfonylureivorans]